MIDKNSEKKERVSDRTKQGGRQRGRRVGGGDGRKKSG